MLHLHGYTVIAIRNENNNRVQQHSFYLCISSCIRPLNLVSPIFYLFILSFALQSPQKAIGSSKEINRRGAICNKSRLQTQRLQELHLEENMVHVRQMDLLGYLSH